MELLRVRLALWLAIVLAAVFFIGCVGLLNAQGAEGLVAPAETPVPTLPPSEGALHDAVIALDTLDSYTLSTRLALKGIKVDETVVDAYLNLDSAYDRLAPAYRMDVRTKGLPGWEEAEKEISIAVVLVGDKAWQYDSRRDLWDESEAPDYIQAIPQLHTLLLTDLDLHVEDLHLDSQAIEVNGVECFPGVFTEKDLRSSSSDDEVVTSAGQACVAVEGGYLVNMTVDLQMSHAADWEGAPGDMRQGTAHLSIEAGSFNQPVAIAPPLAAETSH